MTDSADRLRAMAAEMLKAADGDIQKAAGRLDRALAGKSDLRIALALFFLERVGTGEVEAGTPPRRSARKEIHSRRRKGAHRRPIGTGMPTVEQKAGEVAAAVRREAIVFERKVRGGQQLGKIKIRELRAIVQESGHAAGSFVARGYEDAVDAFLCRKLADHCVATDPDAIVIDIVNGATATKFLKDAKQEAARFIAEAAARIAKDLGGSGSPEQVGAA